MATTTLDRSHAPFAMLEFGHSTQVRKKGHPWGGLFVSLHPSCEGRFSRAQWNCSSSVEPVRAFTLEEPPWITVVTSSK